MNVATKSIAEAPTSSDPAPTTTPEPSTREIIRNLTRELREDVGEQAVETVVAANPLVGLDRSQTLAAGTRVLGRALLDPAQLARRLAGLLGEVALVLAGRSDRKPDPADRRFLDETWRDHPLYRRWMQAYLASREAVLGLVDEVDLDEKSRERGRFALTLLVEALAPTNALLGNPGAIKRAFETGGASLWRGAAHLLADLRTNGGLPSQVDQRPFAVGKNLASTPGAVIHRSEVLELLQYRPQTGEVFERPILLIPPQVNKFYVTDLAPGRSLVEFLVKQGFQTFVVSWRNPTPAQRDWGLDSYIQALLHALDVISEITGSRDENLLGACAGGITTAILLGHLAARGDDRVRSATFPVTVLDTSAPSMVGMLISEQTVASAVRRSRSRGVLRGRDMARVFAWLRPNDLVWNYWVNNYLLGNAPPAFDILYWNADSTNLPATLHAQFLDLFVKNHLLGRGTLTVLGTPIDLRSVRSDVYTVGAVTDHITPWHAVYRTPRLFGGTGTFVLSSSGHIQAIVNPPGNPKAKYFVGPEKLDADPEKWRRAAEARAGSWWEHWAAWLAERSGGRRPAPRHLGSDAHPEIAPAPGRYVHQRADG
jgi:polyhydroxyalkanoate synthase